MTIWLLTLALFLCAMLAMALGVLFNREPIQGSCGGLNRIKGLECACAEPCERKRQQLGIMPPNGG